MVCAWGMLQYTAYVIWCTSSAGGQWEIQKRFKDFRKFRSDLIKHGARSLKGEQFPKRTVGRTTSGKTDEKREPILQAWLNLVVGVYAADPALAPLVEGFLDLVDGQIPSGARVTVSREMAAFEPDARLLEGDWLARGMNRFAQNKLEEERFSLQLQPDGVTLTGGPTNPEERGEYMLENIKLVDNSASGCVLLEFHQVYKDGTRTGWYSMVDRAHVHLLNGMWMALSGVHEGEQVGSFTADKILDDPTPGPYRVVCPEGVLARDGPEASSNMVTDIPGGTEIEVLEVLRRRDGVMRLCFSKAGIPLTGMEPVRHTDGTERLWISERKASDQSLLVERIDDDEQELGAGGGGGGDTYNLTIVGSSELALQEVALQLSGVETIEDLTTEIERRLPELQGATNLQYLYSDPDFDGDFLALEDMEDLPLDGTIQVLGTPAPVSAVPLSEPAPVGSAHEEETGVPPVAALSESSVPRSLNLTVGFNVTVNGVTSLDDLATKLLESISSIVVPEGEGEGGQSLAIHRLGGGDDAAMGAPYMSLDEIGNGAQICLKARAS